MADVRISGEQQVWILRRRTIDRMATHGIDNASNESHQAQAAADQ